MAEPTNGVSIRNLRTAANDNAIDIQLNFHATDEITDFDKIKLIVDDDFPQFRTNDENIKNFSSCYGIFWIRNDDFINARNKKTRQYKCLICDAIRTSSNAMFSHINIHKKERPYNCSQCDNKYYSKKTLSAHYYTNHSDVIQYPYYCPICEKGYIRKYAFIKHLEKEAAK